MVSEACTLFNDVRLADSETETLAPFGDDSVEQMLALAERLRVANGGRLDDAAILAVSEATGAPSDYVRLAIKLQADRQQKSALSNIRAQFLTLEPDVRRYVVSGIAACATALLFAIEARTAVLDQSYGVFAMLALIAFAGGLYNISVAKDAKVAGVCGAILGGGSWAMRAVFLFIFQVGKHVEPLVLIPMAIGGAFGGVLVHRWVDRYRGKLGMKDPAQERQMMLQQLVALQEKLRSGEQSMTFVSVDIVGSTMMKERSDPLSIEFTFNEYHQFVERIVRRYGGRVHSTAGDGVTCAFDHPQSAFGAARTIQAGVMELNAYRNKIGVPIVLRVGVHTGTVVAPDVDDITKLNFAHVIDIAAHMQKYCPPGGVAVSDASSIYLHGGPDSVGPECVEVDGIKGRIWQPKVAVAPPGAPMPPPFAA